ncbi:MAG: hypothetical protein JWP12_250 [Bacteroidetes bacterium]|nr:hypothetical protein [Bacteroidota bacterium]
MENSNPENINQQFDQQFGQTTPPTPPNQPFQPPFEKMELPNATAVLVLGIISIIGCFCYGIIGVTLGIISLVLAGRATALYNQNPSLYTVSSFKNMSAGKICGIIGLIISSLWMFFWIYLLIVGVAASHSPWNLMR